MRNGSLAKPARFACWPFGQRIRLIKPQPSAPIMPNHDSSLKDQRKLRFPSRQRPMSAETCNGPSCN